MHLGPFGGHLGTSLTPSWDHVGAILAYLEVILRHFDHLGASLDILDHIDAILGTLDPKSRSPVSAPLAG
jgi:hypothetical protein